ncbi:hypothetical protein [Streptomyces swartbergensis]|uniref:Uncharacterized protein n=1 Tax=Streptomyces swartbergensis TaxID=487165 RepID=A0A243SAX6_9ACTN|nr:hypothetical protein [Streptomyces swartbergensis]OUD04863.1 hypothetical protein CA983_01655 [Streptomyces swartbergensis]
MEIFVSVAVILGLIVLGVFLIHQLNSQHGDRIAAFHYSRSGQPAAGPAPAASRKAHGRAGPNSTGRRHDHHGPGGHGWFFWRRSRKQAG